MSLTVEELTYGVFLIHEPKDLKRNTTKRNICQIGRNKIPLGIICEIYDLREIDRAHDNDIYPYFVETSIVPLKHHKKFIKDMDQKPTNQLSEILEAYQYAGGIPINMESVQGAAKTKADHEIRHIKHATFGHEIKTVRFRTYEDAEQYIKDIYSHNACAIFGLIGFYLDRPINRIGWTGWDVLSNQVLGKELKVC